MCSFGGDGIKQLGGSTNAESRSLAVFNSLQLSMVYLHRVLPAAYGRPNMACEENPSKTTELARTPCSLSSSSSTCSSVSPGAFVAISGALLVADASHCPSLDIAMSFLGLRKWPTPARSAVLPLPLLV